MLTKRQEEVLAFLVSSRDSIGLMPSTREIQEHFGFASQTAAVDVLRALERKGALKRLPGKARGIVLAGSDVPTVPPVICLPLYGVVAAGYANAMDELAGEYLRIDTEASGLTSADGCFALKVRGDSMIGAHILDGDYVVIDAKRPARHRDIVAALIDGQTTLKRLMVEGSKLYLKAENPHFPNLIAAEELMVQGVMRGLVRGDDAVRHAEEQSRF